MTYPMYVWGDLTSALREARAWIRSDGQRRNTRVFDNWMHADLMLTHFVCKASKERYSDKVPIMMIIINEYRRVYPDYVSGGESFISPHFIVFALQNMPERIGTPGEDLLLDIQRVAKKKNLLTRNADPQPVTWASMQATMPSPTVVDRLSSS